MASNYPSMQAATITETPGEPPRLLDRMRFTLRAKHYSYRTEQAYVHWVRRFILFHREGYQQENFLARNGLLGLVRSALILPATLAARLEQVPATLARMGAGRR